MNDKEDTISTFILVLVLVFGLIVGSLSGKKKNEIQRDEEARARISILEVESTYIENRITQLQSELDKRDEEIDRLRTEREGLIDEVINYTNSDIDDFFLDRGYGTGP